MGKVNRKREVRKQEIIETVIRLAGDTPFEDISISDICEACDISVGAFYHYFHRKSDLLIGFFNLIDDYMEEKVFPYMDKENELENLRVFYLGWADHVCENGLERAKLLNSSAPVDYDQNKDSRPIRRELVKLVERGQAKGQITAMFSPEKTADLILLALRGVTVDWSRSNGAYPLGQKMDEFMQFVLA